jgi:hypothetical protein
MPDATTANGRSGAARSRALHLTETEARALLDEQARSGLSFADFARSRSLSRQRLGWWKAKLAGRRVDRSEHPRSGRGAPHTPPRFVPVVLQGAASTTRRTAPSAALVHAPHAPYELDLGNALTLRIPHDFRDDALARIVRVLREAT